MTKCRVCKSKKLTLIGSLGGIAISNFTKRPSKGRKWPLTLVYCKDCTLLQLDRIAHRSLLYDNYWYQSHINPVITKDLKEISKYVKGNQVLDIGANDGTLLSLLPAKYTKVAVDPSNIEPGNFTWVNDYWENVRLPQLFDTITAIAVIYDLPDPNKFMANINWHLAPDGIFICQLMTLEPMIELNDVGNICHEHIEFYSYKSLVRLFERNGLEIYKVQVNKINGGSYRLFARHYKNGSIKFKEKTYGVKELKAFFKRIEDNKEKYRAWEIGKKVYGYGASTKANTIMQYYKITPLAIVDINPDKLGKWTINSKVPIIGKIPDDCEYLWVFPYGFLDYFKKKEKSYKGKWVTTIPKFKVC